MKGINLVIKAEGKIMKSGDHVFGISCGKEIRDIQVPIKEME